MRKYLFFSWILAVVLLLSCSDDKNEQTPQTPFNEPTSEVKVYTEAEANYVAEEPSENTLVFGSNTPDNVLPKVGEIIQMPISESTPYGFLGRVISVDKSEKITVSTETVPLEEAFPNLSLDADLTEMQNVELIDEDGNPVDFYIEDIEEDSTSMKKARTRGWGVEDQDENNKHTKLSEFDWKKKKLKIPIPESWVKRFTQEKIDVSGVFELSFDGSDIKMDNKDGDTKYIDIDIRPRITVGVNLKGHIKQLGDKGKKEWKTPNLTFRGVIPVGPVTFPITIPICGKAQLEGDFSTSVELRFNKYFRFHRVCNNGKWSQPVSETPIVENTSPWYITEFDASGKFCFGPDIEINIGIYTSLAGLGIEFYPNGYLRANASISSMNPFEANAKVEVGVGMEWRAYCRAELFGKKVEPFSIKLPEVTFIKRTMSLFPSVSEFDATGGSSAAEISWLTDSYYLLEPLNIVKTGTTIYKRDYTEYSSHFPEATSTDRKSQRHYNVNVTGLQAGTTYYAAPTMSVLGFKWVADKGQWKEIETEAKYHLGFRCSNHDYDVISFDFDLNNKTGNVIDYTTEASDYDGSPMRVHITATYNSSSQTLNGIFDFYFYNDPSQQRKDGFSVSLATDDSGYVDCSKVVDNGGCYAALRIHKTSSSAAARKRYAAPLVDDDCNVGIFNKNYTR
jgi:hypothetical protein